MGQKLRMLVEKHKPRHIFDSKGAFNMNVSKITTFNKKSGMVEAFLNFC